MMQSCTCSVVICNKLHEDVRCALCCNLYCSAHVILLTVLLVEFVSCSGVWQFSMCSFAGLDASCLAVSHRVFS
jgi:hypothetical protein